MEAFSISVSLLWQILKSWIKDGSLCLGLGFQNLLPMKLRESKAHMITLDSITTPPFWPSKWTITICSITMRTGMSLLYSPYLIFHYTEALSDIS